MSDEDEMCKISEPRFVGMQRRSLLDEGRVKNTWETVIFLMDNGISFSFVPIITSYEDGPYVYLPDAASEKSEP